MFIYIYIFFLKDIKQKKKKNGGRDQIVEDFKCLRNFYFLHMQWRTTDGSLRRKEALWWLCVSL